MSRSFGHSKALHFACAAAPGQAKRCLKAQASMPGEEICHCKLYPINGSGQGFAASPAIWCFASCRLPGAYSPKARGAPAASPAGGAAAKARAVGLAGGTYGSLSNFASISQDIQPLLRLAEAGAQLRSELLGASGGALELPKLRRRAASFSFCASGPSCTKQPADYK